MFGYHRPQEQKKTTDELGIGSLMYIPEQFLKHDSEWKKVCKEIKENHPYDNYFR